MIRVEPGQTVPLDGKLLSPKAKIDRHLVTGECEVRNLVAGDEVLSGMVAHSRCEFTVVRPLGRRTIDNWAESALISPTKEHTYSKLLAKVETRLVQISLTGALLVFAVRTANTGSLAEGLEGFFIGVLIFCPCLFAAILPIARQMASLYLRKQGILLYRPEALFDLSMIGDVYLDKTGTLTVGKPRLVAVLPEPGHREDEILRLAAGLERGSEHPLAEAIVDGAEAQGSPRQEAADFEAVTGKGVQGRVGDRAVALGNAAMMREMDLDTGAAEAQADTLRAEGKTAMFIAVDGALVGIVAVADPIKESTAQAIRELHAQGLRVIMATGDNERTAQAVAGKLGIDEVRSGILPEAKKDLIDQLRRDGHKIAMAGDGVNDAPALAAADVGIAMGTGADVAMESAGITLLGGDLMGIVRARKLARATLRNIKQNLFFAFAYNALGVPIAAGLLYPVTGLLLSPMIAAAAMSLSSVSVITNALRLRRVDL